MGTHCVFKKFENSSGFRLVFSLTTPDFSQRTLATVAVYITVTLDIRTSEFNEL
jgi:hypothetical protein